MVGIGPFAIDEDGGGVEGLAGEAIDEADDGDNAVGLRGEGGCGFPGLLAEGAAQDQVLGGVARDGEFGEGDDGGAGLAGGGD